MENGTENVNSMLSKHAITPASNYSWASDFCFVTGCPYPAHFKLHHSVRLPVEFKAGEWKHLTQYACHYHAEEFARVYSLELPADVAE